MVGLGHKHRVSRSLLAVAVVSALFVEAAHAQPPEAPLPSGAQATPDAPLPSGAQATPDAPSADASAAARHEHGQPADDATETGRAAFLRGVALARKEQWGEALAAFEEAAAARDAPLVQFNIAICLRALGRYVAAREATLRVLADPTGLTPIQLDDARAFLSEFEKLLVEVRVMLDPPAASLTVDGRPLVVSGRTKRTLLGAVAPPGEGRPVGERDFTLVLDPGLHLFRAARPGHHDVIERQSYKPGERARLDLRLDILPATISVRSVPSGGIVSVNGREVGLAPIEFQRRADSYSLTVEQEDHLTYQTTLDLRPGQRTDLTANLVREEFSDKWYFWPGIVALTVAGGIVAVVSLWPEKEQPYQGGSIGWVANPAALRF